MKMNRTLLLLTVFLCMAGLLFLFTGCGSKGDGDDVAAPTFCISGAALPASVGNSPPNAYYQSITTVEDTPVSITLYACDPDDPSSSGGLA